jgi:hypothetical protein
MKMISKKILTTTLAASVILGGGIVGLLQTKAFADETPTATTAPTSDQNGVNKHFKGGEFDKRGKAGINIDDTKLAEVIGIAKDDLNTQLKAGKSLLQVAEANGFTKDSLLQSVRPLFTSQIDDAVNTGKITTEQADTQRAQLTDKLDKLVTSVQGEGDKGGEFGFFENSDTLTTILGLTKEELKTAQQAGKSIAEIAQEKGISEDDLISKLKDGLTDPLKKFVENKKQPHVKKPAATTDTSAAATDTIS